MLLSKYINILSNLCILLYYLDKWHNSFGVFLQFIKIAISTMHFSHYKAISRESQKYSCGNGLHYFSYLALQCKLYYIFPILTIGITIIAIHTLLDIMTKKCIIN